MKKFISFLVTVLVAVSCLCFNASAEGKVNISVKDVTVSGSGVVGVPVEIENNSGLWGLVFNVRFDTEYFKYSEVRNNAEVFENGAYMIGPKNPDDGYVRVLITPSNTTENNVKNGRICTVYFEVLEDTPDGEYPFNLEIDEKDVIDVKSNEVSFLASNGTVTVQSDYKEKSTSPENNGDIIATTVASENQKTGKNINDIQNQTVISEAFVTDKNGEAVTDSNGEKITEKVIVDEDTGKVIGKYEEKEEPQTDYSIIFIIIGCVLIALAIVGITFYIQKRKKK